MNVFDGMSREIEKSRTPLSDDNFKLPSSVIVVNPQKSLSGQNEFGPIIVRFDWTLLAQTVGPSYFIRNTPHAEVKKKLRETKITSMPEYNQFINELVYYFQSNDLFDSNALHLDENLNREVNKSLLSVRTNLQNHIGTGTATIELENFDCQWMFQIGANRDGGVFSDLAAKSLFLEGLYLTIDVRGRFDNNKFYRIFSGSVKNINITDNPTDRRISITCRDLSKFLTNVRYNIHPAFFETDLAAIQGKATIFSSTLADKSNVDVARGVIPTLDDKRYNNPTDKFSISAFKEIWNKPKLSVKTRNTQLGNTDVVSNNYKLSYPDTMATYGTPKANAGESETFALIWGDVTADNAKGTFSADSNQTHQVYAQMFSVSQLFMSEFKYRSDILNEAATMTYFATYLDASGNIHFHPPRYDHLSSDTKADGYPILPLTFYDGTKENPHVFILEPGESISESYSSDEDSFVTAIQILGESNFGINTLIRNIDPTYNRPYVLWIDGMKRFGFKLHQISTSAIQDPEALKAFALGAFLRRYLERENMTCTIPMRPELDVDRPFYSAQYKKIFHIIGLQHTYMSGGDRSPGTFTTAVTCNAGRPLSQATLITTNIFRTLKYDQLVKKLNDNGINILISINQGAKAPAE
jgi:hypothetical protein